MNWLCPCVLLMLWMDDCCYILHYKYYILIFVCTSLHGLMLKYYASIIKVQKWSVRPVAHIQLKTILQSEKKIRNIHKKVNRAF